MKTVTLELPDEAASMLERGGAELRRTVENVVNKLLDEERQKKKEQLLAATRALQAEAEANGLTDDILQDILNGKE